MAVFAYRALDEEHKTVAGTISSDTPRQARDALRARGLVIDDIRPWRGSGARRGAGRPLRLRYAAQQIEFLRELSTLLAVGIPLLSALETLRKQYRRGFGDVVVDLSDRISTGSSLAAAMGEHPRVFDDLSVSIAEVGEESGTLEDALSELAGFKERSHQLRGRIGGALLYPAVVLAMALIVSVVLMTFVVPNILAPLIESGKELPFITRVVKAASDFLVEWWWAVALAFALVAAAAGAALRTERGLVAWHRTLLAIPYVGDLVRKQAVVHVCAVVSVLMRSGVTFLGAVRTAQDLTANRVLRAALARCRSAVEAGEDIAHGLEGTHVFPPSVIQVFAVGQQSGQLEDMLERLARDYDQQVQAASSRLASLLEPAMILALAVMVGSIAFATLLPILEAGNVL